MTWWEFQTDCRMTPSVSGQLARLACHFTLDPSHSACKLLHSRIRSSGPRRAFSLVSTPHAVHGRVAALDGTGGATYDDIAAKTAA